MQEFDSSLLNQIAQTQYNKLHVTYGNDIKTLAVQFALLTPGANTTTHILTEPALAKSVSKLFELFTNPDLRLSNKAKFALNENAFWFNIALIESNAKSYGGVSCNVLFSGQSELTQLGLPANAYVGHTLSHAANHANVLMNLSAELNGAKYWHYQAINTADNALAIAEARALPTDIFHAHINLSKIEHEWLQHFMTFGKDPTLIADYLGETAARYAETYTYYLKNSPSLTLILDDGSDFTPLDRALKYFWENHVLMNTGQIFATAIVAQTKQAVGFERESLTNYFKTLMAGSTIAAIEEAQYFIDIKDEYGNIYQEMTARAENWINFFEVFGIMHSWATDPKVRAVMQGSLNMAKSDESFVRLYENAATNIAQIERAASNFMQQQVNLTLARKIHGAVDNIELKEFRRTKPPKKKRR